MSRKTTIKNRLAVYPALFAAVLLCTTVSASITGIFTDKTGSHVSGALITFTDESDPVIEYSGYTDIDGRYQQVSSPLHVDEENPSRFQLYQNYHNPHR